MRIRRTLLFLLLLLLPMIAVGCGDSTSKEEPSPYAEYVIPWERDVSQEAADAQELHFYFMAGNGLVIDTANEKGQIEKWGDCCLVVFPNGETMLIDGADYRYTPVLMENLKRLGVEKVDYIMLSHPHQDHYGGLFDSYGVLYNMPVGQAYWNGDTSAAGIADYFKLEDVPLTALLAGDTFEIGGVKFQVLSPDQNLLDNAPWSDTTTKQNNSSLVIRMDYGEFSALFTGDLYTTGEKMLVDQYKDTGLLDVDLLKLPHHGDTTSSSALFADTVTPKLGVATGALTLEFPLYMRYAYYADTILHDKLDGYAHVYTDGTEDGLQWETSRERGTDAYDAYDAMEKKQ